MGHRGTLECRKGSREEIEAPRAIENVSTRPDKGQTNVCVSVSLGEGRTHLLPSLAVIVSSAIGRDRKAQTSKET